MTVVTLLLQLLCETVLTVWPSDFPLPHPSHAQQQLDFPSPVQVQMHRVTAVHAVHMCSVYNHQHLWLSSTCPPILSACKPIVFSISNILNFRLCYWGLYLADTSSYTKKFCTENGNTFRVNIYLDPSRMLQWKYMQPIALHPAEFDRISLITSNGVLLL